MRGASEHNLQQVDVDIPLEMLTCITGVSGSGKSTLVHDIIFAGLKKQRGEWQGHVGAFQKLDGGQHIDDVILVDQSPIGRTPRSNPVTYIAIRDQKRYIKAQLLTALNRRRTGMTKRPRKALLLLVALLMALALPAATVVAQEGGTVIAEGFNAPQGVLVDPDGNVWVIDSGVGGDDGI